MPEYFDISLIGNKDITFNFELVSFLNQFRLDEERSNDTLFKNKEIIISNYENEDCDYDEFCIGISELSFNKKTFDLELIQITNFVNRCFECSNHLKYALCSFEINACIIGEIKRMDDFNKVSFLNRFPIAYYRILPLEPPKLNLNVGAQDLF